MLKNIIIAALAALTLAAPAFAETYTIDSAHSSVSFAVRHMVITNVKGNFGDFEGHINLEEDMTKSSVEVTIKTASINTGHEDRDKHLKSPDFLDVEQFTTITFKSTKVTRDGDNLVAHGDLTIRDKSIPVQMNFVVNGPITNPWGQVVIGIEVQDFVINRHDWGVSWSKKMDNGGLVVGDEISIELQIEAKQASEG
jgi:polyisoprenoid-binding protein YceI